MTWLKMVALTATATLSRVITSWRSPVRGVSRMSTRSNLSMNGVMIVRPAWDSRRKRPKRVTTPANPWGTTRTAPPMRIATTMSRTTTMIAVTRPLLSTESASLGGRDHKGGAAHFDDGNLLMRRYAARGGRDREPAFIEEPGVPRMVLITDGLESQGRLSDQVVRRTGHGQLRPEMTCGHASKRGSHGHGADESDGGSDDRLQPDLRWEQRDYGRREGTQREEKCVERLGVDLHPNEGQAGDQPDHPHPGHHGASVP